MRYLDRSCQINFYVVTFLYKIAKINRKNGEKSPKKCFLDAMFH